jgi:hypothetical protein
VYERVVERVEERVQARVDERVEERMEERVQARVDERVDERVYERVCIYIYIYIYIYECMSGYKSVNVWIWINYCTWNPLTTCHQVREALGDVKHHRRIVVYPKQFCLLEGSSAHVTACFNVCSVIYLLHLEHKSQMLRSIRKLVDELIHDRCILTRDPMNVTYVFKN